MALFPHLYTSCSLCLWLATPPFFIPTFSPCLQVQPNLFLPSYQPFSSLLNQWELGFFTGHKKIIPQQLITLSLIPFSSLGFLKTTLPNFLPIFLLSLVFFSGAKKEGPCAFCHISTATWSLAHSDYSIKIPRGRASEQWYYSRCLLTSTLCSYCLEFKPQFFYLLKAVSYLKCFGG